MLFYKQVSARSFSQGQTHEKTYVLDILRVVLGIIFLAVIIIAAFVAEARGWENGSSAFLHLAEILGGGLIGMIIGERNVRKK